MRAGTAFATVHLGGAMPTERFWPGADEPSHGLGLSALPESRFGSGRSRKVADVACCASSWSHDDAIPGQVKASTQAVAEGGLERGRIQRWCHARRVGTYCRTDAEDVGRAVILALITPAAQATRTCRRKDTQFQQARAVL